MSDTYLDLLNEINAKLDKVLAGTSISAPVVPAKADWWNPIADEEVAFALATGAAIGTQKKIAPLADPFNVDKAKQYAKFGFRPNGIPYVWTREWLTTQRQTADKLHKCGSAQEAEAFITNAGAEGVTEDAVVFAIMTGMVEVKPFMSPAYTMFFEGQLCQTIEDQLAFWNAQVDPVHGGPGPSGDN